MGNIIEEYGQSIIDGLTAGAVFMLSGICMYTCKELIVSLLEGIMFR